MLFPPSRAERAFLTRAKTQAVIAADRDSFLRAVDRHIDRVSGLPELFGQIRRT